MALSNVSFRMDEALKEEMKLTCQELGMDMTTAFVIYAKKLTREKRIPFDVAIDPFYSESNQKALQKSFRQLEDGKTVTKTFDELLPAAPPPADPPQESDENNLSVVPYYCDRSAEITD